MRFLNNITISDVRYYTLLGIGIIILLVLLFILFKVVLLYEERRKSIDFKLPPLDVVEVKPIKGSKKAFKILKPNEKKALESFNVDEAYSDQVMYKLMEEYENQIGKKCKNIIVLPNLLALQFENNNKKDIKETRANRVDLINQAKNLIDESFDNLMNDLDSD